jgi:hypothetical protein
MRFTRLLVTALAAVSLAACGSSTTSSSLPVPTTTDVTLDQQFTLSPGQTARIPAQGLEIRFDSVSGDSRCPEDVVCVWAGDAAINLTLTRNGQSRSVAVHTTLDPKVVVEGGVSISLVKLAPNTSSKKSIPQGEYRVQLLASTQG